MSPTRLPCLESADRLPAQLVSAVCHAQEAANSGQEFDTTDQALIAAFLAAEEDICGMQALDASNSGSTATLLLLQVCCLQHQLLLLCLASPCRLQMLLLLVLCQLSATLAAGDAYAAQPASQRPACAPLQACWL